MPKLLDESSQCNTLFTKYEQVLKFDEKMRELENSQPHRCQNFCRQVQLSMLTGRCELVRVDVLWLYVHRTRLS